MTDLAPEQPSQEQVYEALGHWTAAKADKAKATQAEGFFRKKLFGWLFPDPDEGTNRVPLGGGWSMKGVQKFNRSIDPGQLQAIGPQLAAMGVNLGLVVKWEPELIMAGYKALTPEQKLLFDSCLTTKPGAQELEIEPPKEA